jgi:hypothetical protein
MTEHETIKLTEREKYFTLLGQVCEKLPYYAAQLASDAGLGEHRRFQNVKQGKAIGLADLVALVRHCLPDFEIPEHLLPEVAEQEAIA